MLHAKKQKYFGENSLVCFAFFLRSRMVPRYKIDAVTHFQMENKSPQIELKVFAEGIIIEKPAISQEIYIPGQIHHIEYEHEYEHGHEHKYKHVI